MQRSDVERLLKVKPFRPFTLRMSSGDSYIVRHPENCISAASFVVIVVPEADDFSILDYTQIANADLFIDESRDKQRGKAG